MGVRVTDNFNRANVDPIAGVWQSAPTGLGTGGAIVSNQLTGTSVGGSGATLDNFIFYNNDSPPNDQYCKIAFISTTNSGSDLDDGGPCVRFTAAGSGYLFNVQSNNPVGQTSWNLFTITTGTGSSIANGTIGNALSANDIVEIRAKGTTISGFINGVAVSGASVTDSTFTSGAYAIHLFSNLGRWDNFEGGDFTTAGGMLPLMGVG